MARGKVCAACNEAKGIKYYASKDNERCLLCEAINAPAKAAEISQKVVDVVDAPEPEFPVVELDYTDPSAKEIAARTLARRKLLHFIRRFKPKYLPGWVHEDICRRLERFMEAVERGEEPRLLLMCPPRMGKSEIGSRHFAPWVLGHHPDWEIIAASHTGGLTMSFSRYIRDLLRDPSYHALFPNTKLDPSSQSVENWNLTRGGGYLAAGVGTGITGRGAHILLLDDLVKDMEAADSQTQRDSMWEWYASTAYTRLAPGGGVLGIMCMTGDTPVLMADGTYARLDSLVAGDSIATYDRGTLKTTTVKGIKTSGRDFVLRIKTTSGRIVRANGRHPFLATIGGELKWIRARSLSTTNRIVTLSGSGGNGKALSAQLMDASLAQSAATTANHTTLKNAGQTGTEVFQTENNRDVMRGLSTGTASVLRIMKTCSLPKKVCALFAKTHLTQSSLNIGTTRSLSTTVTTPEKYADCSATTATQESDILELSPWHSPQQGTSDFTLDGILSIEPDGEEEVFDVQVEHTENFVANGLVSHNTWWHEDDWAGRIQQVMETGEGDNFEIVKYPAINDMGDEYLLDDDSIVQLPPNSSIPAGSRMTRLHNTAVHVERYSSDAMLRIKRNLYAAGQQRVWSALYQQNPTPNDGMTFTKHMFKVYSHTPQTYGRTIYQAWDFAITTKQANDWTVGVTVLHDENDDIFVLHVNRFRSDDGADIMKTLVDYAREWGCMTVGVEDGQIWKSLESTFVRICGEEKYYPAYEVLQPLTDKMVRAQPLKGRMQAGKVWFPEKAPWYQTMKTELLQFPAGKHDDQVDSLAWVVRLILRKHPPRIKAPPQLKSWKDKLKGIMRGQAGNSHMSS